jgi:hypothetical protein
MPSRTHLRVLASAHDELLGAPSKARPNHVPPLLLPLVLDGGLLRQSAAPQVPQVDDLAAQIDQQVAAVPRDAQAGDALHLVDGLLAPVVEAVNADLLFAADANLQDEKNTVPKFAATKLHSRN